MRGISIHDTVHGYIEVPGEYVDGFIDTPGFQRLRRIEQTAIRSVFPTARHDRFVHSLGVYYVGKRIVDHFKTMQFPEGAERIFEYIQADDFHCIEESYKIACLLHDIGHAPFSHTFEGYFDNENKWMLAKHLNDFFIDDNEFQEDHNLLKDITDAFRPNYHEYTSAIVAVKRYGNTIRELHAEPSLVARMIIGCKFHDEHNLDNQLKNIFIELLHGEIIDADRLDYACRDIWASGYCTSAIDLERLIHAMQLRYDSERKVVLCYNSKVVNEIESVLAVRDFQCAYIINHHTIVYDQYILRRAAECMACEYYTKEDLALVDYNGDPLDDEGHGLKALGRIISVEALMGGIDIGSSEFTVSNIADEDLLYLMKSQKTNNPYYKEWSSRCYDYFPLWKTPDEFYQYFEKAKPQNVDIKEPSFSKFKEIIENALGNDKGEDGRLNYLVEGTKIKSKVRLSDLSLVVNDRVVLYKDLYPSKAERESGAEYRKRDFYFVYYRGSMKKRDYEQRMHLRNKIIDKLREPINTLYDIKARYSKEKGEEC